MKDNKQTFNDKTPSMKGRKGRIKGQWVIMALVATIPPVSCSEGKCFKCMDKERCPNAMSIFDQDETMFSSNKTLPACSEITLPRTRECVMCQNESKYFIGCFNVTEKIEVEDHGIIKNISVISCDILQSMISVYAKAASSPPPSEVHPTNRHYGLIPGFSLPGIVLLVLIIVFFKKRQPFPSCRPGVDKTEPTGDSPPQITSSNV